MRRKEMIKPIIRPGRSSQYAVSGLKKSEGCRGSTRAEILISFKQRPIWECNVAIGCTLMIRKVSFEFHVHGRLELSIHLI